MSVRKTDIALVLVCLLAFGGAWWFWQHRNTTGDSSLSPLPTVSAASTAAATATPSTAERTLVVVGDQSVLPPDVTDAQRWTSLVAAHLSLQPVTLASSGAGYAVQTTTPSCAGIPCGPYAGLIDQIHAAAPYAVLIAGGYRDAATDSAAGAAAADDFLRLLTERLPRANLIVVNPWRVDGPEADVAALNAALEASANTRGAIWVSVMDPAIEPSMSGLSPDPAAVQERVATAVNAVLDAKGLKGPTS